jgi:hypothetical protein
VGGSKMKKRIFIATIALSASLVVGSILGQITNKANHSFTEANFSAVPITNSLQEDFWNVDLIIKGTVTSEGDTFKKDAGVQGKQNNDFDVTPATIQVNKILYGDVPSASITYLQHGSSSNKEESKRFVKVGQEVVLVLVKTSEGKYWSYNFDDGIWNINNGKVSSNTESQHLLKFKGADLDTFTTEIAKAAKNKTKNASFKQTE